MVYTLNVLFGLIYLALFVIGVWVGVDKIGAGDQVFVSGQNFFLSAFFLVVSLCSAVFHWDARRKPLIVRHGLFLSLTLINLLVSSWLARAYFACADQTAGFGDLSCVAGGMSLLTIALSLWVATFAIGSILFFKITNMGTARVAAGAFSVCALWWSYINSQGAVSYWAAPFVLALIGVILSLFLPHFSALRSGRGRGGHSTSRSHGSRGFTLIELLVVISIISLLSSVVLSAVSSARAKALDSKRKSEMRNMSIAMNLYFDRYNAYPGNPYGSGTTCADQDADTGTPGNQNGFSAAMGTLVSAGFLAKVPDVPTGTGYTYCYYRYNTSGGVAQVYQNAGALLVTSMQVAAPTTMYPGTCRPFTGNEQNWCNANSSRDYCLCHPY